MSFAADLKDFVKTFSDTRNANIKAQYMQYLMGKKDKKDDKETNADFFRRGHDAWAGESGGGGKAVPVGDPVSTDMAPHQRAFLNAVASGESPGGAYNVRYDGGKGTAFDGDEHPNVPVPGPEGPSTAAGRYMFTNSTWNDYGGGKFDPGSQDKRAWQLAVDRYKSATGGDLDKELQTNGFTSDMAKVLSPTWTSFRNPSNAIATYNDSYGRYAQPPAGSETPTQAVPASADVPLPPPRPPDVVSQALPLDPYNTEAVYAASGGLIPDKLAMAGLVPPAAAPAEPMQGRSIAPMIANTPAPDPSSTQGRSIGPMIVNDPAPAQPIASPALNIHAPTASSFNSFMPSSTPQFGYGNAMDAGPYAQKPLGGVKGYAGGGTVEDDDEDTTSPTSFMALASDNQGGGSSGASPAAPAQRTSIVPASLSQLPFSGLPDILHDAITHIQDTYGLSGTASALPSDAQKRFASGADAADKEDVDQVKKMVDPHDQMTEGLRNVAGLNAVYQHYLLNGEPQKAAGAAAAMLLYSQRVAREYGKAALNASDAGTAAKIVAKGYNDTVPDGKHLSVDENGNYVTTDLASGKPIAGGKFSPADVLKAATGLKDGTGFWHELTTAAGGSRKAAGPNKLDEATTTTQALDAAIGKGAAPTPTPAQGAPAQAVPTTPTPTPASDTSAPDTSDDNSDNNGPVIEGRTAGSTSPKVGQTANVAGMPANFVDSLPNDEAKAAFRKLQLIAPGAAAAREAEYQRALALKAAQQQGPAPKKTSELHQIEANVNSAWDDYAPTLKTNDGKELAPKEVLGIKTVARHLAGGGMFAGDAVGSAAKMTSVNPSAPIPPEAIGKDGKVVLSKVPLTSMPFQTQKRDDGVYATFPDGSPPIKLNQEAFSALRPILQRKFDAIAAKQKTDDAGTGFLPGAQKAGQAIGNMARAPATQEPVFPGGASRADPNAPPPVPVTPPTRLYQPYRPGFGR